MPLKIPRWPIFERRLIITEVVLLVISLLIVAYEAATRVQPLPVNRILQKRGYQKPAGPTILDYYRQYPDRYIRVENESWQLNSSTQEAIHSFTLRNLATVAYKEIVVRFTYESAAGKTLLTREVKIPGQIQAQGKMNLKNIKITGVPAATGSAVLVVAKALMIQ